jgi:transcriptional regulator with XRE-family HTH domain
VLNDQLARLRVKSGLTQEELSERSGVSVRTIRNLERGQVRKPRRSSVDLLLTVLGPDLRPELTGLGSGAWRGPRPPRTSLVGRSGEVEQLAGLVAKNQVVVISGPGGVGKSRVALAVAEDMRHWFADGVAVVEMGQIPAEHRSDSQPARRLAPSLVLDVLAGDPRPVDHNLLLVLDNTEHLPLTTAMLVERLLDEYPSLHILITTRRPPKLHGAGIWEIPPLPGSQAVDLLLQRVRTTCPTLDLSGESMRTAALCQQLDGIPRLIEFAAHLLRLVSLPTLLADDRATRLLGSADFAVLPHQRTLADSLRWSLSLLDERQRNFLTRLARFPGLTHPATGEGVELLAELADASLLQVVRGSQYEYRMMRHVRAFLVDCLEPVAVAALA